MSYYGRKQKASVTKSTKSAPVDKSIQRYVKNAVKQDGETKRYSYSETAISPTRDSTTESGVFQIAQGTTSSERIGSQISPMYLKIDFTAYRGLADCHLRLVVFRWKLESTVISTSSLFDSGIMGTDIAVIAPYTQDRAARSRFEILYDETYLLDDAKQNGIKHSINVNLKRRKLNYTGVTATAGRTNGIYYRFFTDNVLASTPLVNAFIQTAYKDE